MRIHITTMYLIWYNPDRETYEKGDEDEYQRLKASSFNANAFNVLYEFSMSTKHIADKIMKSLNIARESENTETQKY